MDNKRFTGTESILIDNYLRTLADTDIRPRKKLIELKRFVELSLKTYSDHNEKDDK